MSAEYCLHIRTPDITDEEMEIFFSGCLGSKYDPYSQMLNEMGDERSAEVFKLTDGGMDFHDALKKVGVYEIWLKWDTKANEIGAKRDRWSEVYHLFTELPSFDVGEVSFLKANLFDDSEKYIPSLIQVCCEIIGDGTVITDEVIRKITDQTIGIMNTTGYALCNSEKLIEWLIKHKGEQVFSISW